MEINSTGAKQAKTLIRDSHVFEGSISDYPISGKVDLALIKGVLIHINPDMLGSVYEKHYQVSSRPILIAEYHIRHQWQFPVLGMLSVCSKGILPAKSWINILICNWWITVFAIAAMLHFRVWQLVFIA